MRDGHNVAHRGLLGMGGVLTMRRIETCWVWEVSDHAAHRGLLGMGGE